MNKRWYKLLYCSPALFPIYFRAARRESSTYPARLQQTIGWERNSRSPRICRSLALLWYFFGSYAALRTSIIPVFFVFPDAFTLNRLGQHYDIDPDDPAKWGTLMKGHWFWDFAFLNSNYHLEHHYFPGVPFYRLPALQRALIPFYERKQHAMAELRPASSTAGSSRTTPRTPTGAATDDSRESARSRIEIRYLGIWDRILGSPDSLRPRPD